MAGYHPLLFTLIALLAMAELGLSAFWVHQIQHDPSSRFKSLIILFLFNSVWTTLFAGAYVSWIIDGALHELASIGSSGIWLVITAVLCRELLAVEAIGWTEMGLCILTLLAALFWARSSRRSYRGSYYV
ncbi:hypothetical protein B0H16DRAFT_1658102 [Mycena metata]|uniref:Uncharacterized protein n=1 Tax=Mycena metata TaxID=1033252 RepID=A0AAD7KH46_9AGAR|nr:hypothetical protein B0H16DRAFT_1658102 [Mycena metata]